MATKNFYEDYTHIVNPSTKNTIINYTGQETVNFEVKFETSGKDANKYMPNEFINISTRVDNDLYIETYFIKRSGSVKIIKTTIKDYYTNDLIPEITVTNTLDESREFTISKKYEIGKNGLYGQTEDTENDDYIIASKDKYAELTLTKGGYDHVGDYKGNDKYIISKEETNSYEHSIIYEATGTDEYYVSDWGYGKLYDGKGNDKYTLVDNARCYIAEVKGNDEYKISSQRGACIDEISGNDKYLIENILHNKGFSQTKIYDISGKDNYTIKNTVGVEIIEYKGNDKYTIENFQANNSTYKKIFNIDDWAGNDTYNISKISHEAYKNFADCAYINDDLGNDKYTFTDVNKLEVDDKKGNDKYTLLANSKNINLYDYYGKDKYELIGTEDKSITDTKIYEDAGNDTYNLIYTSDIQINDDLGNDKYTITNTSKLTIEDLDGKDKYTIDKLTHQNKIEIKDNGYDKDSLIITNLNAENIIFFGDVNKNGNTTGDLIIFDKENKGYIKIDNYFNVENGEYTSFGEGCIESIKAGKTKLKINEEQMAININSLNESVASWLSTNDCSDIYALLNEGSETEIINLITYCTSNT